MGGGGKGGSSTSTVSIPPEVLAQYKSVMAQANNLAAIDPKTGQPNTAFQPYTGQFTAGLVPSQRAGVANINAAAGMAQPYYGAGTQALSAASQAGTAGLGAAQNYMQAGYGQGQQLNQAAGGVYGRAYQGAQPINQAALGYTTAGGQTVTPEQIQQYSNPYMEQVMKGALDPLRQQQAQEQSALKSSAIQAGAFGGDRGNVARALLSQQQGLATGQLTGNLLNQNYQQALAAAQADRAARMGAGAQLANIGQQQYAQGMGLGQAYQGLGAQQFGQGLQSSQQQAALAGQRFGQGLQESQQLANLGTGAQGAALQGAQAQIGAGTLEQQAQQADLTARYQQFLQQQGYPFQLTQFLGNLAMGTGALSGSTTSTSQASDRRLKHDVVEIGKTHDGQPIYKFKYNNDNTPRIGLMAQDVEKEHPNAVGVMGGYKFVDYDEATKDAERPERAMGGVIPNSMGGSVYAPGNFAAGGYAGDDDSLKAILASQAQFLNPYGQGVIGGAKAPPGAAGHVPQANLPTPKMIVAQPPQQHQQSGLQSAVQTGKGIVDIGTGLKQGYKDVQGLFSDKKADKIEKTTPGASTSAAGSTTTTTTTPGAAQKGAGLVPSSNTAVASNVSQPSGVVPNANDALLPTSNKINPDITDRIQTASLDQDYMPDAELDNLSDIGSVFAARGGVIPSKRSKRSVGGNIDPYGVIQPGQDPLKVVAEEGDLASDEAEKIAQKPSKGGAGGGGSLLGDAAGIVGIGSSLLKIGSFFLADGGVVPHRKAYQQAGVVPSSDTDATYDPRADLPSEGAVETSKDPDAIESVIQQGLPRIRQLESGGKNVANYAGASSAFGPYQFLESTFANVAKKHPEAGVDPRDHRNPDAQEALAPHYARDLAKAYDAAGVPFDFNALRMGWAMGERGGPAFMASALKNPDAPSTSLVSSDVIKANPTWFFNKDGSTKTAQDTINTLTKGGGGGAPRQLADASSKIGRGSSLGDVFESVTSDSVPSGGSFWLPALAAIGTAMSSRAPTRGQAIGEGLLGGVAGYQEYQKIQNEAAKNVMTLVKDRFRPVANGFYDTYTDTTIPAAQMQKIVAETYESMGGDPRRLGIKPSAAYAQLAQRATATGVPQIPGAEQPPAGTTAQPQAGQKTQAPVQQPLTEEQKYTAPKSKIIEDVMRNPDFYGLGDPSVNPRTSLDRIKQLQSEAQTLESKGFYAEAQKAQALAAQEKDLMEKRLNSAADYYYGQGQELAKSRIQRSEAERTDAKARMDKYQVAEQQLTRLGQLASQTQTGPIEERKRQFQGVLEGLGMGGLIPDFAKVNEGNIDTMIKMATQKALEQMAADKLVRAPGIGTKAELSTVPNPSLDAGTVYELIGSGLASLRQNRDRDLAYTKSDYGTDPGKHHAEWYDKNKIGDYTKQAFESIPAGGHINPDYLAGLEKQYGFKANRQQLEDKGASSTIKMPEVGFVKDGFQYTGGNPADPSNWKKVQ